MLSGEKIKEVLYSVIEEIGKENIQVNVASHIESSQEYLDIIMNRCITKLTYELDDNGHATLGEALLHFMLTISTLPSERKVEIKNDLALDIVIPSLPSLLRDPNKSIIIQIIKDKKTDLNKVENLEFVQPNAQNIWLISTRPLSIANYTEYSIFANHRSRRYSNVIVDIDKFLKSMKDKSFRFVP
ncbi:MAG TPA: hypothetical protein VE573_05290 [Nitrososphaeraceae archaeon]|nr:hypothetical protein [Nitrososphaeraceae archaeon]